MKHNRCYKTGELMEDDLVLKKYGEPDTRGRGASAVLGAPYKKENIPHTADVYKAFDAMHKQDSIPGGSRWKY